MESSAATPPALGRSGHVDVDELVTGSPAVTPPADDPDLAPVDPDLAPAPTLTGLDALRSELAQEVEAQEVTLVVPGRPGYAVRYAADVTYDELTEWRKRAKDSSRPGGLNELRLACIVLANQAVELTREQVGTGLAFNDGKLIELLGAHNATDAVRRLYGLDGHVTAAANVVLAESGFGEELAEGEDADPTRTGR